MNIPIPDVLWLWGPGVFILILGYMMFNAVAKYIGKHFLEDFLDTQKRQASAIEGLCSTISSQQKDDEFSHREIILCLQRAEDDMKKFSKDLQNNKDGIGRVEREMKNLTEEIKNGGSARLPRSQG